MVKKILDLASTVLVIAAASILIWRQLYPPAPPGSRPPVQDAKGTLSAEIVKNVRGTGGLALVEFADYQCPYCGKHAREVNPSIRSEFVDKGALREIFVNFPLSNHPQAQKASEAAECAASQGHFWEMHDSLFGDQAALAPADLLERSKALGLDAERFSKCLNGGESVSTVEQHKNAGMQLSVSGTPAFFLGVVRPDGSVELKRRINGAAPLTDFRNEIQKLAPNQRAAATQ